MPRDGHQEKTGLTARNRPHIFRKKLELFNRNRPGNSRLNRRTGCPYNMEITYLNSMKIVNSLPVSHIVHKLPKPFLQYLLGYISYFYSNFSTQKYRQSSYLERIFEYNTPTLNFHTEYFFVRLVLPHIFGHQLAVRLAELCPRYQYNRTILYNQNAVLHRGNSKHHFPMDRQENRHQLQYQ